MSSQNLTVQAPKEVVDALVALDGLVQKIVAKETPLQILTEELSTLVGLAGEVSALPADVAQSSDQVIDAAELYGRRIVYRLLGLPVVPVVVS